MNIADARKKAEMMGAICELPEWHHVKHLKPGTSIRLSINGDFGWFIYRWYNDSGQLVTTANENLINANIRKGETLVCGPEHVFLIT